MIAQPAPAVKPGPPCSPSSPLVSERSPPVRLGLKENWRQFALLVLINAFVGGMVGIEPTVVPLIGAEEFGIASTTLVVSFIVSFACSADWPNRFKIPACVRTRRTVDRWIRDPSWRAL